MWKIRTIAIFLLTFFIFNGFCVNIVDAGLGGSIEPARIDSKRPLVAGGEFELPSLKVTNDGEEGVTFYMSVVAIKERHAPPAWFAITPVSFSLDPGSTQEVEVILRIPTSANPGDYCAGIQAFAGSLPKDGNFGDNDFNVALISILQFTVEAEKPDIPLPYLLLLVLVLAAAFLLFARFKS